MKLMGDVSPFTGVRRKESRITGCPAERRGGADAPTNLLHAATVGESAAPLTVDENAAAERAGAEARYPKKGDME